MNNLRLAEEAGTNPVHRTVIETTITPTYIAHWGVGEAMREILQNAIDQGDYDVAHTPSAFIVVSKNVQLRSETLLLGFTTKQETTKIGKFGEGYKLALLVFARENIPCVVRTGRETWHPIIEKHSQLGHDVLKIVVDEDSRLDLSADTAFAITAPIAPD